MIIAEKSSANPIVSSSAATSGHRFHELDSMRGLAALIVVFYHFRLMWLFSETQTLNVRTVLLYPLFAGRESVILFFLLSGFVLSIPYLRGKRQPYSMFLRRRILRIYCPYLFGLALAVAGNSIWHGSLGLSQWADWTWLNPVGWKAVLQHVVMIGNYDSGQFNTAFWSLVVEMRVSIVFPLLFLLVGRLTTRTALLVAAGCSLAVQISDRLGSEWVGYGSSLQFVTVFICGILMAIHWNYIGASYRAMTRRNKLALTVCSFVLYGYSVVLSSLVRGTWRLAQWHIQHWPVIAGAAGLMTVGLESTNARRILNSVVPRFLGRISYSLYLVHGTVLFALAYLLIHRVPTWVAFLIFFPAAILLSTAFCICIEEPFLRLGRRVGRIGGS
jgi:peptidoglycan/LPS O-acetylase OafA/YrhL